MLYIPGPLGSVACAGIQALIHVGGEQGPQVVCLERVCLPRALFTKVSYCSRSGGCSFGIPVGRSGE
jgi:hypothetical protein